MYDQETVTPETEVDLANESYADNPQEAQETEGGEDKQVPLHALQKERRKRQEMEQKLEFYENQTKGNESEDDSRYESATREDLSKSEIAIQRKIEEKQWAKDNPELYKQVNEDLPQLLKRKPNLATAINDSTNRYAEAWDLMKAFNPKKETQQTQQQQEAKPPRQAPGSPSGVPKAAAMGQNVNLMKMSDADFNKWRKEKQGKR